MLQDMKFISVSAIQALVFLWLLIKGVNQAQASPFSLILAKHEPAASSSWRNCEITAHKFKGNLAKILVGKTNQIIINEYIFRPV